MFYCLKKKNRRTLRKTERQKSSKKNEIPLYMTQICLQLAFWHRPIYSFIIENLSVLFIPSGPHDQAVTYAESM